MNLPSQQTVMTDYNSATHSAPQGPSREGSEIINSMVVSPPEDDIQREKQRQALAQPHRDPTSPTSHLPNVDGSAEPRRSTRSRHDHGRREKHTKFGEYILGNTIGEGEFGKVKLGWKQGGGVQVAIKLIKKDQLGNNPARMNKIVREVAILQKLTHPNIVRLHKMEESERHFGIVLEYASGGELFDHILKNRYLKDNAARRLFAQLVSGVGYLHKKGIVHRDLKLENLLLDRNRNIIITDFGFANTFNPDEELTEEEEWKLTDREFVKQIGLDQVRPDGTRRADLMQTSCGSPCYAAPELVVSDSLYTGRRVDVWSCGVILYAMLAGYLPFDDDPANPEGDNINLLYKYIVNTPLTFPEYVSPHARDLLRQILVANPRKRADLFEVARHTWLSDYAHVVEFITSSTTTPGEIQNTTVLAEDAFGSLPLVRSASMREAFRKAATHTPTVGGLASKQGNIDQEVEVLATPNNHSRQPKSGKRRTVQVEYVAPTTQTRRGETAPLSTGTKSRSRSGGGPGPIEVTDGNARAPKEKAHPREPPTSKPTYPPTTSHSARTSIDTARRTRENRPPVDSTTHATTTATPMPAAAVSGRPATSGSKHVPAATRSSFGQPLPPELAGTNVHGRIQQPPARALSQAQPMTKPKQSVDYGGRPSMALPTKPLTRVPVPDRSEAEPDSVKGHRRSNTIGDIVFGRRGSAVAAKPGRRADMANAGERSRKYPPISMNNAMVSGDEPRPSTDSRRSRRSFSNVLNMKRSGSVSSSNAPQDKRRFSLIPQNFSLKSIGIGKDYHGSGASLPTSPREFAAPDGFQGEQQHLIPADHDVNGIRGAMPPSEPQRQQVDDARSTATNMSRQQLYNHQSLPSQNWPSATASYVQGPSTAAASNLSMDLRRPPATAPHSQYSSQSAFNGRQTPLGSRLGHDALPHRGKPLADSYAEDDARPANQTSGTSRPARKVMDFFRKRGKTRGSAYDK